MKQISEVLRESLELPGQPNTTVAPNPVLMDDMIELSSHRLRLTHLGLDRAHNEYWELSCDVSQPVVLCHVRTPPGAGGDATLTQEPITDAQKGESPRPKKSGGRKSKKDLLGKEVCSGHRWLMYSASGDLTRLLRWLNEKGIREAALKKQSDTSETPEVKEGDAGGDEKAKKWQKAQVHRSRQRGSCHRPT
eukprot:gene36675-49431_t